MSSLEDLVRDELTVLVLATEFRETEKIKEIGDRIISLVVKAKAKRVGAG